MINNFLLFKISTNFGIKEMFLEKIAQGGAVHFIPGLGVIIQKKTISILLGIMDTVLPKYNFIYIEQWSLSLGGVRF